MPEWIGKTIGKVRIEKYLARGGMAEVYLGTHITLDRRVAVKRLHSHIEEDPSLLARFQREARVVAALRHPNIVQIFDFDALDGHPFIVMEYLPGPSLAAYLRDMHPVLAGSPGLPGRDGERGGRLPFTQVGRLLTSLAAALDYAHGQGVIHRDVKPGNILLHAKSGEVRLENALPDDTEPVLTDFGLVRIAHSAAQTSSGIVTGTPAYMSPEQARGDKVDSRTDVYSLGIALYEMLAGRVPFEADSTMAVLLMHINQPPPPIEGIPPAMQRVIERALEKDADRRYQTCRAMAADFLSAVGLNAQAQTIRDSLPAPRAAAVSGADAASKPDPVRGPNRKRLWVGSAAVIGICLLCFLASTTANLLEGAPTDAPATETSLPEEAATSEAVTFPPTADGVPVGVLRFQDGEAASSQVTLSSVLMAPPEGSHYEAWLVGDGGELRRSLGVLAPGEGGAVEHVFADPQNRSLLERFDRMEITLEPDPDDNPNPSGQIIYSSALPPEALTHIRHLIIRMDDTPGQIALVHGLYIQTDLVNQHAAAMLSAYESGDEAGMRLYAEAVINLLVGNQAAEYYGDWDGNGEAFDPGDGFGLLLNGEQSGYINGAYSHADYAATAADATAEIKYYGENVKIAAQNLESWAVQLRDLAAVIVQSPVDENTDPNVRAAADLAVQMLWGVDADGSQAVDPVAGESGVMTLYEHAYYMADMPVLPGADQMPPPGQ